MKYKLLLIYIITCAFLVPPSFASKLPYSNIKDGSKIKLSDVWTSKVNKKDKDCYLREGSQFISQNSDNVFDTECTYIFIYNGRLFGYSDLKFYELTLNDNGLDKRELVSDEVSEIFENFKIIKITDFATSTNSYRYKRKRNNSKIIILNNTSLNLTNYSFHSDDAKYGKYPINNAIKIKRHGMIQFTSDDGYSEDKPVYVILVR